MLARGTESDGSAGLGQFITVLATEGRALVSAQADVVADAAAMPALVALEARARVELAGEPPSFSAPAALWAARVFYEACRATVCRELGPESIRAALGVVCPAARGPGTDWSVDLAFRHLPDLFRFARYLSNADPLVATLQKLGTAWPLSSVGMPGLGALCLDSFVAHPVLLRLYADRVEAAGDFDRAEEERVAEVLRADLGLHRDLAPALAARLYPEPATSTSNTASAS